MEKRIVKWKAVRSRTISGRQFINAFSPDLVAMAYRGELLDRILAMPRQQPISYADAINLACEFSNKAFAAKKMGYKKGETHYYHKYFLEFISEQGFHIELTGDEFYPATYWES